MYLKHLVYKKKHHLTITGKALTIEMDVFIASFDRLSEVNMVNT